MVLPLGDWNLTPQSGFKSMFFPNVCFLFSDLLLKWSKTGGLFKPYFTHKKINSYHLKHTLQLFASYCIFLILIAGQWHYS